MSLSEAISAPEVIDPNAAAEAVNKVVGELSRMDAKSRWAFLWEAFKDYLPQLILAVVLFFVGMVVIRLTIKLIRRAFSRSKLSPTLHNFLLSIVNIAFYILLGITVMATLGLPVGSLIAVLSVFGLAISLAVKDSLSNLAGGMSVLFTKPFALGDYVQIDENEGTVDEIRLNYTVMRTFDNKLIHIPNGDVAKAQIVNYNGCTTRRLDLDFPIGYRDDFESAKRIINEVLAENPLALRDPEPIVRLMGHDPSAVQVGCRVWVTTDDYWTLRYDLLEAVRHRLNDAGFAYPYSQLEVHLKSKD